jgi:hypothetical protein
MPPAKAKKVTLTVKKPPNPNPATKRTRRTRSSVNGNNLVLDLQLQDETRSASPQATNTEPAGILTQSAVTQVNPAVDGRGEDPNATELGEIAAMRGTSLTISPSLVHDMMLIAYSCTATGATAERGIEKTDPRHGEQRRQRTRRGREADSPPSRYCGNRF